MDQLAGQEKDVADPRPQAVRYCLRSRGFFSEFNVLAFAYAHSLAHGRKLLLDPSKRSRLWLQLFSRLPPFWKDASEPLFSSVQMMAPKAPDGNWTAMRREVRDACFEKRRVSLPALPFEGTWDELVFFAARKLFRPCEVVLEQVAQAKRSMGLDLVRYSAVQLRRGDKVHGYRGSDGRLIIDTKVVPFEIYATCLQRVAPGLRDVFVLSDDYEAVEEARSQFPQYRLHTLCESHERGYFHADHQSASDEEKLVALKKLLASVIIARESKAFVGTHWSNLSTAVYMLHAHQERCMSVDPTQAWPPADPLFMPGNDVTRLAG